MKKAKFEDVFKLISGSCISHYDEKSSSCESCKIFVLCKSMKEKNKFPKSEEEVKKIINGYK